MSDNWLILVPEVVGFVPAEEVVAAATARLRCFLPDADAVDAEVSSRLQFIDCGGYFEHVYCPHTGREIDRHFWQEAMEAAHETGFADLSFRSPHSAKPTSLSDLVYDRPQGFARFTLRAMNPGLDELPRQCMSELEALLGCRLKTIRQHL